MTAPRLVKSYSAAGVMIAVYRCEKAGDGLDWHNHAFGHTSDARIGRILCETEDGKSVVIGPDDAAVSFRPIVRHRLVALDDGAEFQNMFPAP